MSNRTEMVARLRQELGDPTAPYIWPSITGPAKPLLRTSSEGLIAFSTFPALVSAVETGLADEAVLPIENSIEGSINTTLDLLIHETTLHIIGELVVPVRHFLITRPGTKLEDIRVVTSHPQPFGQCRRFLDRCLPGVEEVASLSTSTAVKEVAQVGDFEAVVSYGIGLDRRRPLTVSTLSGPSRLVIDVSTAATGGPAGAGDLPADPALTAVEKGHVPRRP